jgi:anti-sigma regulatory factor (Ser/Thr protein kinase)
VTSAQARDLTYGRRELRPPGVARKSTMPHQDAPLADSPEQPAGGPGAHSELVLRQGPESVKAARDFTADTLRGWQLDALIDEAMIIVAELVTNANKHGTCLAPPTSDIARVEVAWQHHTSCVICAVTDETSKPPVLGTADIDAESGRGLQVVHALAVAWGWVVLGAREKAVWAALLLP